MSALTPTAQQQAIVDAAASGGTVAISAAAGSGKTSTLRMIADARPGTRMLYVAYNKAIQLEAAGTFPSNVTCKTAHSLAYAAFGRPMRRRLNGPRVTASQAAQVLGVTTAFGIDGDHVFQPTALASLALVMVARFCRSAETDITARHLAPPKGLDPSATEALAGYLVPVARRAWADLTAGDNGRLKPSHDVYLKLWQLSEPELAGWDVILYDEAQDADPCIAAVIERQGHAQLIAVGDSAQAIYGWRGAGDFLARVDAAHRLALTQSWRFGETIAEEANVWLEVIGAELRVAGNPARHSRIEPVDAPAAVLCRSNAGTIDQLLDAHAEGVKVHLVGDGTEMLRLAQAARRLQDGKPAGHLDLVAFTSWQQVVDYAENDPGGSDLAIAVRMIERYEADGVIRAIEATVPAGQAELRVSTAHKAKGLEWDQVQIANDYPEPLDPHTGEPLAIPPPDAMLAYVAVTRARSVLDNRGLAWVHDHLAALANSAGEPTPPAARPALAPDALALSPDTNRARNSTDLTAGGAGPAKEQLADGGLGVGSEILVAEERGTFVVRGISKDGSLVAYRPDGTGGARNFRPEWCAPAARLSAKGKRVKLRGVPAQARAARTAWRAQHNHARKDVAPWSSVPRSIGLETG